MSNSDSDIPQMMRAILTAVETLGAKIEAIDYRTIKIEERLSAMEQRMEQGFDRLEVDQRRTRRHMDAIESSLDETIQRVAKMERH